MSAPLIPRLYRETRLNLEPADARSTVVVNLPASSSSSVLSRSTAKRIIFEESPIGLEERDFAKRHLACEASVFFRHKGHYPRCFLWRVLDERKVLELQSVDLTQDANTKSEAILTIRLQFSSAIRPFGIAFADREGKDALNVFVLTTANDLYTIILHKDVFTKHSATEGDVSEWCKAYAPTAFSFRYPYRLFATNPDEIFLSLHDGGLLKMTKKAGEDGSKWQESFFAEGGWALTLRNFVPRSLIRGNSVRFQGMDLETSAVAAVAISPDKLHIYTVCMDHTLKAWNQSTGRIDLEVDLLWEERDPKEPVQYTISASQKALMQIVEVDMAPAGDLYYVITYSPKRHQFMFWAIRDADRPMSGLRDAQPEFMYTLPLDELMGNTAWTLEEFYLKPGVGWSNSTLWIRARSGPSSKVFSLTFDALGGTEGPEELKRAWNDDWVTVDAGSLTTEALKCSSDFPLDPGALDASQIVSSSSEQWQSFLFYPGRFTIPTLEAALSIYEKGSSSPRKRTRLDDSASKAPLKQRLTAAISHKLQDQREGIDQLDHAHFEEETTHQWQIFHGLVRDLHKRRSDVLSLSFDFETGLPWLLSADFASIIRRCSEVETLELSSNVLTTLAEEEEHPACFDDVLAESYFDVAALMRLARTFRRTLPKGVQASLRTAVAAEAVQEPVQSPSARIEALDARCDLCAQVPDEDYQRLVDSAQDFGGFRLIRKQVFNLALLRLNEKSRGHQQKTEITRYGAKMLIRGAQETLQEGSEALLDLIALAVFLTLEVDEADLSEDFDGAAIFVALLSKLREFSLLSWLASTTRQEKLRQRAKDSSGNAHLMKLDDEQSLRKDSNITMTLLESLFIGDWSTMPFPERLPLPALMTYWIRAWTFGTQLDAQYDAIACHVMGNLLKQGNLELADDFLPYIPNTPWATYLKGRLYLAQGDYDLAAVHLKKAAFGLGLGYFNIEQNDSAGLLDNTEREFFSDGLARFYQHLVALFDQARAYSHEADFASLALQSFDTTKGSVKHEASKADVLSRLFHALLHDARFEQAYSALVMQSNATL